MRHCRAVSWTGIVVLGGLMAWAAGSRAFSQGKQQGWEVQVAYDAAAKRMSAPPVALRPNISQPVFLYLKNSGPLNKKNVDVALVRLGAKGERVLSTTNLAKVPANQAELVKFKPAPPVKADVPGKAPVPAPPDVDVPPFLFELRVNEPGKETVKLPLPMNIMQPLEYTQVDRPVFEQKRNRLSVRVEVNADAADPPCVTELVFDPAMIPGLLSPKPKPALLIAPLTIKNRDAVLFGDNLQFAGGAPPKYGRVALTIDGYERAYQFKTTFGDGTLQTLRDQVRVRVKAPTYFNNDQKPGPKGEVAQLVLHLEADGIVDADTQLEVAVNRGAARQFIVQEVFPGLRRQTLAIEALPEGGLKCKTEVRDWTMALDTTGLAGRRTVRLRALGADGNALVLADEQTPSDETLPLFAANAVTSAAPLRFDKADRAVYADIIIDSTLPENVKLVQLPAQVVPGEKVVLKAQAAERDKIEQAPITGVVFFLGEAPKEPGFVGKLDPAGRVWQAEVLVPSDVKDQVAVSVRATTATGLTAADKAVIPVGAAALAGDSKITGLVSRDGRIFAGKMVQLRDSKKKTLATAQTDDKGIYVFTPVKSGTYSVFCSVAGMFQGTAVATVTKDKGETIKADVILKVAP